MPPLTCTVSPVIYEEKISHRCWDILDSLGAGNSPSETDISSQNFPFSIHHNIGCQNYPSLCKPRPLSEFYSELLLQVADLHHFFVQIINNIRLRRESINYAYNGLQIHIYGYFIFSNLVQCIYVSKNIDVQCTAFPRFITKVSDFRNTCNSNSQTARTEF